MVALPSHMATCQGAKELADNNFLFSQFSFDRYFEEMIFT